MRYVHTQRDAVQQGFQKLFLDLAGAPGPAEGKKQPGVQKVPTISPTVKSREKKVAVSG